MNIKNKCQCLTNDSIEVVERQLKKIKNNILSIEKTNTYTKQISVIKKKQTALSIIVAELKKGIKAHDEFKDEYMKNMIMYVKTQEINARPKQESIKTVAWNIGKHEYNEQQNLLKRKRKKKK